MSRRLLIINRMPGKMPYEATHIGTIRILGTRRVRLMKKPKLSLIKPGGASTVGRMEIMRKMI